MTSAEAQIRELLRGVLNVQLRAVFWGWRSSWSFSVLVHVWQDSTIGACRTCSRVGLEVIFTYKVKFKLEPSKVVIPLHVI